MAAVAHNESLADDEILRRADALKKAVSDANTRDKIPAFDRSALDTQEWRVDADAANSSTGTAAATKSSDGDAMSSTLLERFVNKSHRSTDEVAGDATQAQNTNDWNLLTCYYGRTAPREDKRELP